MAHSALRFTGGPQPTTDTGATMQYADQYVQESGVVRVRRPEPPTGYTGARVALGAYVRRMLPEAQRTLRNRLAADGQWRPAHESRTP
jgi:hypothetical protein